MNNDNNKKKILMKSAVAFSFALAMFGANAGADVSAEEAMATGQSGFNSTFDDDEDGGVQQGDEADNGDDTKGITTNMEENNAETVSAVNSMLGAANGYNVFVKGDYNVSGADISSNGQNGNLAAGGNVSVPSNYTAGKVVVGGEVNGSFLNGTSDEKIDFNEAFTQLQNTSNSLANLDANGKVTQGSWTGEICFNGSDPELNVFNITVEEYNKMYANTGGSLCFSFNVPKGSHCVVNIIGSGNVNLAVNSGAFYAKEPISNGTDNNKNIIFNLPDAQNVTIQDNMGAVMAVNADVKSADGVSGNHFEGSLICNSYTGGNEFGANSYDDSVVSNKVTPPDSTPDPDPTPDPEPTPDPTPDPEPTPDPTPDPEPTPDPTPDPEPTPDPTPDPEPTPDPTPDPEPTPDPTPDPEPTPDPTPDPEPTPDPTPDPEPTPDPTPDPEPTPDPTPDPEPTPDPTPDPEPTPDPTPDPEPTPDPTPDPEPTPDPTPDPEPTPDPTPDPEPTPDPTPDPEPTPDPTPDPEPTPDPTPDPEPTPDPTPDPEPTPDPTPDLEPTPDPTPDPEPAPDPTPDPEPTPDPTPDPEPTPDPTPDPEPTPDPTPDLEPTPDPTPDIPYNPYETIETFDEPEEEPEITETPETEEAPEIVEFEETEIPLNETPFEEEEDETTEDVNVTDFDTFETFDDAPVPLADDPFGDAESATDNPKTGEDLTVPAVSAAAAMAAFLTILYANKKKREEAQG